MKEIMLVKLNKRLFLWVIFAVLFIVASAMSLAFDASSGTINSRSVSGYISAYQNSSIVIYSVGTYSSIGRFDGSGISGYFGVNFTASNATSSNDTSPPVISLVSPANHAVRTSSFVNFTFSVTDDSDISNCVLYIDEISRNISYSPLQGINMFSYNLTAGFHNWSINCTDIIGYSSQTSNRLVKIIIASNFDNETTDLSIVNVSAVPNLTLAKSGKGKVKFSGNTNIENVTDLDSHILISNLSIIINTAILPELNKSATLTIYNVPYNNIAILKDGAPCSSCTVQSYFSGTLIFDVTGFSNYTVTSSSRLEIFDDSDNVLVYPRKNITFYANYTNTTSGQYINANCNVTINANGTDTYSMSFNSSFNMYTYRTVYNFTGGYDYDVTCAPLVSGFDTLSASDNFIISSSNNNFADIIITSESSSRMNITSSAKTADADAGNLTEINLMGDSITDSWQGYYGNITGTVMLKDANNNTFYNWDMTHVAGEIYASRSISVDWVGIRCADISEMYEEDILLGINSSREGDSLNNTFFNTVIMPDFYVGNININDTQDCYSTTMYNSSGVKGEDFHEILLSDGYGIIYTGIIDDDILGFDGRTHDFQLLVGENGKDTAISTYYFFIELG